ncbi:MAG: DNA-deoxyinosine glycosylase [Sphingomonadales bacterium]|nr:DNA-deoxyinosine glycosylase [Sphingomonadales bacterium]
MSPTDRDHGLAPQAPPDTRVLVLGSLPGRASLRAAQYYAHPSNHFWRLMAAVIDHPDLPALPYPARLSMLNADRVGLWDTVASAVRPGSLDAALRDVAPRDLAAFTATLPHLRAVAFNGATAARLGRRQLAGSSLALIDLPSSSAAHAAMPYEAKLTRWRELAPFLAD